MRRALLHLLCASALLTLVACQRAPQADADAGNGALPPSLAFSGQETTLLFSFVDEAGSLRSVDRLLDIPAERRRNVMVVDLTKSPEERQADRYVYFADVTSPGPDGKFMATVVSRYQAPTTTAAPADPVATANATGAGGNDVVVYSAVWCGYCKKTKAFLKQRGVPYIERDVEKDPGADKELRDKAKAAGVRVSGVPVTDFKGQLVMGFDQARLDQLIKQGAGTP